jgi:hypothetical protein
MDRENLEDPDFGRLTWNSKLLLWKGHASTADGTPFVVYIATASHLTHLPPFRDETWDRTITPHSREAFARVRTSESAVRDYVIQAYLPKYPRWNEGDRIDATTFSARLTLETVTLFPDGCAEVFYQDGGMFGGHALIAHLDSKGVPTDTELFG